MFDDRIVVESPGKLPGLIKTENIRHTHFSRNPKIAEFLKAYSFVKEYGEGVERMCKELEAVGMKAPEYRLNAFMLQVTVWNKKALFGEEKHCFKEEKALFKEEKVLFEGKKHGLLESEQIDEPKILLIGIVENAVKNKIITSIVAENIKKVIESFEFNQILGRKEIKDELRYGDSKAGKILETMQLLNIITSIKGKGKGKYILKEPE